ncbi:MAG: ROK family protein [Clostridia bacterium]|nr:ROK family protein [Clostridia bacterium]
MYIISAVLENEQSRVALYDKEYNLILKKSGECADLAKLCLDAASEGGIKAADVDYIGIAIDGSACPCCVAADVEKATGIKCNAAPLIGARALGEAYVADDEASLIMLKIDDTVDCGIVIDRKIYAGANHLGGKIAHMVIDFDGYECTCGRKGCFEAYASNSGFRRIVAEAGIADAESMTPVKLYAMNTPAAEEAKKLYVEYLTSGITTVINLFQPHELVLEGPFTEVGDAIMAPMMEIILREQYSHGMPNKCNIRFSNTEADTALIGAALLGR